MANNQLRLIQVVRRYGSVGGMERYVLELTRELSALGHDVTVVCEECLTEKPDGVTVCELGTIVGKLRWLNQLRFSRRVGAWLRANPHPNWIIHSHERFDRHQVTTFHGATFARVLKLPWWQRTSVRVFMHLFLERIQLSRPRFIVPNSFLTKRELMNNYPEFKNKLTIPIMPGVVNSKLRANRPIPSDGGVVGFVAREWRGKGLLRAIEITKYLRKTRPNLELWVIGPDANEISHLFSDWRNGFRLFGWVENPPYSEFDVLLHPARSEAYGMVIGEAMAAQVPVVVSDVCGAAAQVVGGVGVALPLKSDILKWVNAVDAQLKRDDIPPPYTRTWKTVALKYEQLYQQLQASVAGPLSP